MAAYRAAEILQAHGFTFMQVIEQKGRAQTMRLGADSRHAGETMILLVKGATDGAAPAECRAKTPNLCFTVPIVRTMERIRPLLTFPADGT
jgi:hypothetical protein